MITMYSCTGELLRAGEPSPHTAPPFHRDSIIKFELDFLTEEGTLRASLDGGDFFKVFTNLKSLLASKDDSFLPWVHMVKPGAVTFLGFEDTNNSTDANGNTEN